MKKSAVALVALCLLVLAASTSQAGKTFRYPSSNPVFSITFPDGWSMKADPDATVGIIVKSPDEEIEIDVWTLSRKAVRENPQKALDDAAREVASLIVKWVDDFEPEKSERFTVNGIEFYEAKGTAKDRDDGSPVKVAADFFSPDGETVFVMMYWGSEEAEIKYAGELARIARSIGRP